MRLALSVSNVHIPSPFYPPKYLVRNFNECVRLISEVGIRMASEHSEPREKLILVVGGGNDIERFFSLPS